MNILPTKIADVFVVEHQPFQDNRGAFGRLFCEETLNRFFAPRHIVQINHSRTSAVGAIRGLHFQHAPHAEMKLIRCLKGKVWDVVVDLRANSETFLQWHAQELTAENGKMFVIPEGCAHGFQVLSPDSELLYLHTAAYQPDAEGAVRYDDPRINIPWPLPVTDLSARDMSHDLLSNEFAGLTV
jgi:dTDP-4-dehydrorhamnose 3,5-epimerase